MYGITLKVSRRSPSPCSPLLSQNRILRAGKKKPGKKKENELNLYTYYKRSLSRPIIYTVIHFIIHTHIFNYTFSSFCLLLHTYCTQCVCGYVSPVRLAAV